MLRSAAAMPRGQLQPVVRQIRRLAGEPFSERDDAFLLDQFATRRDERAFEALVRRHGRLVRSVCRHVLRSAEDAEDAFQATFLVLARKAGAIRKRQSLASWLHGVALRAAWNARKSAMRRRRHENRADERRGTDFKSVLPNEQPVTEAALREVQAILDEEVQRLPEKLRAPFVLCCLEAKSKAEAARVLSWKEGTVSGRLAQARERLRDRLTRRGVSLTAALCALAVTGETTAAMPAAVVTTTTREAIRFLTVGGDGPGAILAAQALQGMSGGKIKATALLTLSLLAASAIGYQLPAVGPQQNGQAKSSTETPKAESQGPRTDLHCDPLPEGAIARMGTVRMRHGHPISGVVFSGDGKSIIASDYDSGIHVWNVAEGKEIRRFFADAYYCHSLALSPDGQTLAVALGDQSVRLCDPSSGREFASLPEASERNSALVFSPDGLLLTTGIDYKSVLIWDVATRRQIHKVAFNQWAGNPSLSGDGKLLACSLGSGFPSGNSVCLWDLAQDKEVRLLRSDPNGKDTLTAIFAPKGDALAVWGYEDASIRLFEANGVKEIRRFKVEGPPLTKPYSPWGWSIHIRASFSPSGKTLAIFREVGKIELWDVETGKKLHTLACDRFHKPAFLVFSPDGTKLASAGRGWGYWGDDNNGGDNIVRVWDVTQGKEMLPLAGHGAPILAVAISPNGKTVATASPDGIVHLWERSSGKHLFRLEGHPDRRPQVAFSSDGRRVMWWGTYARHGTLRIWDARTGQEVSRLKLQGPDLYWRAVSDNEKTALSVDAKGKSLRFHDLATGKITHEIAKAAENWPIGFSPAGDKLVCSDGTLRYVGNRKELLHVGTIGWPNRTIMFSADGRKLFAAVVAKRPQGDARYNPPAEEIAVIDPIEGKELRRFGKGVGNADVIDAAALSRDCKMVVTAGHFGNKTSEQIITLWETETGKERGHFLGHRGRTNSIAISADGRFVVSAGEDTSALVWDATRPQNQNSSIRHESAAIDLPAHFKNLAGDNAEQAYASIWALINAHNKTVSFPRDQSNLFATTDVQKIQRWIQDLDSDEFTERERASQELGLILDEAESHLKKALQSAPSLEVRRRIDRLLQKKLALISGRELQRLRVLEVLEHIAAPGADAAPDADATRLAAIDLLKKLAAGAPEARLTQEAKAALERLDKQRSARP